MKRHASLLTLLALLTACGTSATSSHDGAASGPKPRAPSEPVEQPATSASAADRTTTTRVPLGSVAPPPSSAPGSAPAAPAPSAFGALVASISEPDGPFFSDNIISNETSYLQIASQLEKAVKPGGAYIGVGPEQNFTYLALTKPKVAFILDIRRQNMIEQLLYKAVFTEAKSRAHFLALLMGRAWDEASDPGAAATIDQVLAHAEKNAPDEALWKASHDRLRAVIEREMPLDAEDKKTLEVTHRAFFKGQLDVRFELKPPQGRVYPKLREILAQKDPEGNARGFLASEDAFRFVQTMEREGRIIPVVGDFAGDRAMPGIAAYLAKEKLTVSAFYTSNVEQYLLEPKVWTRWARNVAALPVDDKSLFIRCYLDQGKKHPQQMKGHRAATVLQRIGEFNDRQAKKSFASWWEVATERVINEG